MADKPLDDTSKTRVQEKSESPLVAKAAIPPTESAIKLDGGQGGCCRVTLDLYLTCDELPKVADLRGKRLIVVFTEEPSSTLNRDELGVPNLTPLNLEGA